MRRDLVDVPDDFYYEKQFFEKPEELTEQFGKIEQDNLMCILRTQEAQEQYDNECHVLKERQERMGSECAELQKNY